MVIGSGESSPGTVVRAEMNESEIRRVLCEILGVDVQSTNEEIKKAYTSEAKKWHPDRVQHNPELAAMAEKKLKDINQAYECLTDRAQFDKQAAKLAQRYVNGSASSRSAGTNSEGSTYSTNSASSEGSTSSSTRSSSADGTSSSADRNNSRHESGASADRGTSRHESGASANRSNSASAPRSSPDGASIVKIFVATGIFVIIVVLVANLSTPRSEPVSAPGVTLSPSESPAAPFSDSRSFSQQQTSLPSESSVGGPPGSN